MMSRKGFPESYDRRGLLRFVSDVKSGAPEVHAPVYSHLAYDIVPGETQVVRKPDILIIEGLNVLLPGQGLTVADLFDFSIYVDAHTEDIARWYVERFLTLRDTAFADPDSHFHHYASLSDDAGARRGDQAVAEDQRAEPGAEHPADPAAGVAGAAQGRRPPDQPGPPAQALISGNCRWSVVGCSAWTSRDSWSASRPTTCGCVRSPRRRWTSAVPSCPGLDRRRPRRGTWPRCTCTRPRPCGNGRWPAPWPPDLGTDVLGALDDAYRQLVGELTARKPTDHALTWYEPDQTVGFWFRRMAQETVIHRLDAELAAGVAHDADPRRPRRGRHRRAAGVLPRLRLGRVPGRARRAPRRSATGGPCRSPPSGAGWQVQLGPTEITVERGQSDPEAGVFGEPSAVLRWVWRRAGDDVVQLDGNRWVIGKLRTMLGVATQ